MSVFAAISFGCDTYIGHNYVFFSKNLHSCQQNDNDVWRTYNEGNQKKLSYMVESISGEGC